MADAGSYVTSAPLAEHVRKLIEDREVATALLLDACHCQRFAPCLVVGVYRIEYRTTLDWKTKYE